MVVNHEDTLTCHTWALPGSSVDPGKDISETVWEAFETEAGSLQNEDDKQNFQSLMGELFDDGKVVYRGYVDDPRNTVSILYPSNPIP
jgi:ADP-ribose pyrophosphatase